MKNNNSIETITSYQVAKVIERLSEGKRIRRSLPRSGRVHIDRTLPFIVVCRTGPQGSDTHTARLVRGEASYLVAAGDTDFYPGLNNLVSHVVATLSNECASFLVIEIWAGSQTSTQPMADGGIEPPAFCIHVPKNDPPTRTVETLERSLQRIKILRRGANVCVETVEQPAPPGLKPLLSAKEARLRNCFMVGLEIQPIYWDTETGQPYPLVLRSLHRSLSVAFKRAAFEFARLRTPRRPANYQALGRRAFVKAVWQVDQQLARISQSFDYLLLVTPINADAAWKRFHQNKHDKNPVFYYRPLPIDPSLVKRRLYQVPIERIEDPTLASVFREKRCELDRMINLLTERGKPSFVYSSQQLFGGVRDELLTLARRILAKVSPRAREDKGGPMLDARAFAQRVRAEFDYYRNQRCDIDPKVSVRDDVSGVLVSQGQLLVGSGFKVAASRVEGLLQHEVGTHVLTYLNAQAQPFQLLCYGLAGYEPLQEGLAVLAEYLVGDLGRGRLRLLAGRVVAVHALVSGAAFVEAFRLLHKEHGFKLQTAFNITMRVYRGGGLTKDAVYLQGLASLLDYLQDGGDLNLLWVGKIAADHTSIMRELMSREVLIPAPLHPRYLEFESAQARLAKVKSGATPLDLIEGKRK